MNKPSIILSAHESLTAGDVGKLIMLSAGKAKVYSPTPSAPGSPHSETLTINTPSSASGTIAIFDDMSQNAALMHGAWNSIMVAQPFHVLVDTPITGIGFRLDASQNGFSGSVHFGIYGDGGGMPNDSDHVCDSATIQPGYGTEFQFAPAVANLIANTTYWAYCFIENDAASILRVLGGSGAPDGNSSLFSYDGMMVPSWQPNNMAVALALQGGTGTTLVLEKYGKTIIAGTDWTPGANTSDDAAAIEAAISALGIVPAPTITRVDNVITWTEGANSHSTAPYWTLNTGASIGFAVTDPGVADIPEQSSHAHVGSLLGVVGQNAFISSGSLDSGIATGAIAEGDNLCGAVDGKIKKAMQGFDNIFAKALNAAADGEIVYYRIVGV